MKKKMILIVYLLGFLSCFFVVQINNKYQLTTIKYNNLVEASGEVAIMVFDESQDDYIRQESVPIGNYVLNNNKTHCLGGGEVISYDKDTGKVEYKLVGADTCYLYFDDFPLTTYMDDYTLAWNTYPDAVSYEIYSNDTLLTSTTDTNVDLYKYFESEGVYEIDVRALNASGNEIKKSDTYKYTLDKYNFANNYLVVNYDYLTPTQFYTFSHGNNMTSAIPEEVKYINLIEIRDIYNSGAYSDGGTFTSMTGVITSTFMSNIPINFCTLYPELCITMEKSLFNVVFDETEKYYMYYNSSSKTIICNYDPGGVMYGDAHFIGIQFVVPGKLASRWERLYFHPYNDY